MIYFRRRLSSFGFLLVVLPGVVVIGVFCTLQHFILTQDDSLSLLGTPASLRQLTEKQIRWVYFEDNLSRLMTKSTKWHVRPAKTQMSLGIRPGWSESLLCAQWVAIRILAFFMQTAKTLIRLGGCPGWSESSLGSHATLLVLSWGGSFSMSPLKHRLWVFLNEYPQHMLYGEL